MADSVISYEDLIGKDDTFDDIFANIEQLKGELIELAQMQKNELGLVNPNDEEAVKSATKEVQNLTSAMKKLDTQEKKAQKTKKKSNDLTNEELIAKEKQKIVNRERLQVAKQMAILTSKESGQIEKLRAKLSLTTIQWKKLTKEELDNTKKGKNLIKSKLDLTNQLKKLEKQTGDTRRNVGNYTAALGKMGKMAAGLVIGRSMMDGLRKLAMGFGRIIDKNKETDERIGKLDKSMTKFGSSLMGLGASFLGFISGPLSALLDGVTMLFNYFSDPKPFKGFIATSEKLKEKTKALTDAFVIEEATMESLFVSLNRTNKGSKERKEIIDEINKQYGEYLPNLLTEKSSLSDIADMYKLINEGLAIQFRMKLQTATQSDIVVNKVLQQNKAFEEFKETASKLKITVGDELQFAFSQLLDNFDDTSTAGGKVAQSMKDLTYRMGKVSDEVRKTNPDLADLFDKYREMNIQQKILHHGTDTLRDSLKDAARETNMYNKAIEFQSKQLSKLMGGLTTYTHATTTNTVATTANTTSIKGNTAAITDNLSAREKAIESLLAQIRKLDAENEEDKTERLLALEDVKFQTLQTKRKQDFEKFKQLLEDQADNEKAFHGDKSAEHLAFQKFAGEEIIRVGAINQELSEAQLQASENRKLQIIKTANDKREAAATKTVKTAQALVKKQQAKDEKLILDSIKSIDGEQEKVDKKRQDRLKNKAELEKQLMVGIQKTAEKVGAAIVDTFNKQAAGAASLVEKQSEAVESQRERAEKGLSNTLKFEQEQLAQREAERIRADKKAKHAAELVALFNLVSAYAASGDSNAMARGLVDWSLLKALSEGFEEGGYTGSGSSNSDVAGLVHANEYVVTADDVKRYGLTGRAGGDFGEAMSDYFYSPLQRNMYLDQQGRFNDGLSGTANTFVRLENEVRAMRRAFEDMPKNDFDILQMTDYFVEISKRVTSNRMTNVSKQRKRL